MPTFTIYVKETGQIKSSGFVPDLDWYNGRLEPGQGIIPVPSRWQDQYIVDDQPVDMPQRPSLAHTFDYAAREWVDPRSLQDLKLELMAKATATRWERENGGLALPNGVRVLTGKADQDRITSVIVNSEIAGIESVDFKADSGWVTLALADLKAVARAVALHVQACFSAERAHHEAIDELADLELALAYDTSTGWPG
jgi:hypothetical protein